MGGGAYRWPIADAWRAAARVAGAAYGVEPEAITAPTRGRGPKPPEAVQRPKKMAVHLAVILAGCDYAAFGRVAGLHKDTVSSHCAGMRAACADEPALEAMAEALEISGRTLLTLTVGPGQGDWPPPPRGGGKGDAPHIQLAALERFMANAFDAARGRMTSTPPSDPSDAIFNDHGVVISLADERGRA